MTTEAPAGIWRHYQSSMKDALRMYMDLRDTGTVWCVSDPRFAMFYLSKGDMWMYYTADAAGEMTVPRIAIQLNGNRIGELVGPLGEDDNGQEIELEMMGTAIAKVRELGLAEPWEAAASDVMTLRRVVEATQRGDELPIGDLAWLYSEPTAMYKIGFGERTFYREQMNKVFDARDQQADIARLEKAARRSLRGRAELRGAAAGARRVLHGERVRGYPAFRFL